jgi:hypothetical protein
MLPYKNCLDDATLPEWQQAALASSRGACARSCGQTSARNPYLDFDSLPPATGQSQSTWFHNCDSWWKGWDGEDARCRDRAELGHHAQRSAARATRRHEGFTAKR